MTTSGNIVSVLIALVISIGLAVVMIYFVQVLWPLPPPWLSLIFFILLAIAVIGCPIYTLAQWSDRYLARQQTIGKSENKNDSF